MEVWLNQKAFNLEVYGIRLIGVKSSSWDLSDKEDNEHNKPTEMTAAELYKLFPPLTHLANDYTQRSPSQTHLVGQGGQVRYRLLPIRVIR